MLDKTTTWTGGSGSGARPETRFLPALAASIATWFPDLGGRSLAVSNVEITKANIPTLPLVMVAFARSESTQPARSGHPDEYTITDFVVVEFWLEPDQYRKADGTATPFWSYYPYEEIRDQLLTYLARWYGPHEERLAYRSLGINADQFAVTLTFGFEVRFQWCPTVKEEGEAFTPYFRLCAPANECLPDSFFKPSEPALP
jgi:hypothetical protein